ncbi:hypothetical protein F1880_008427 [Penicillium rolfsii]|nr:hypothetical protein F1880_008427 [Penicillium rolfsii]
MARPYLPPRRLRGDEYHVVAIFQDHADTCLRCRNPVEYRLCEDGLVLADDVAGYLQKRDGHCIALHHNPRDSNDHVDLPRAFDAVHRLLDALGDGLGLHPMEPDGARGDPQGPERPIDIIEVQPRDVLPTLRIVRNRCLFQRRPVMIWRRRAGPWARVPPGLVDRGPWQGERSVTIRVSIRG